MGKIAFVFSGQGAQYSGMGKSFYDAFPFVKDLYDNAEKIRPDTKRQSFEGTDEELKQTENTQPCLYLVQTACCMALNEKGVYADCVAGFSLGEIAALSYAKAYGAEEGFDIVTKRGALMGQAAKESNTSMSAIMKLSADEVTQAVKDYDKLYAVNYNSPGQTVVSGLKESVDAFSQKVTEMGGKAIPLAVSAAFHSPFMADAAKKFGEYLSQRDIKKPEMTVYANYTAQPYGENVAEYLENQMKSPVRWQETVENMIADGVTDFIEVGAGKTLCGLIKKISKDVKVYSVQDVLSLEETVCAVKGEEK